MIDFLDAFPPNIFFFIEFQDVKDKQESSLSSHGEVQVGMEERVCQLSELRHELKAHVTSVAMGNEKSKGDEEKAQMTLRNYFFHI